MSLGSIGARDTAKSPSLTEEEKVTKSVGQSMTKICHGR